MTTGSTKNNKLYSCRVQASSVVESVSVVTTNPTPVVVYGSFWGKSQVVFGVILGKVTGTHFNIEVIGSYAKINTYHNSYIESLLSFLNIVNNSDYYVS